MAWGLLQGLGQGMAQTGDMLMRSHLDELKEQRLQQYRLEAEQRKNEREDSRRSVREEVTREGDKQITTQYNEDGEVISTKESILDPKDPQRRFYASGGTMYDAFTGEARSIGQGGKADIKEITDQMGNKTLVQVRTDADGNAYYTPVQQQGLLQPEGRTIDQSRAWAEERVGKGWLKDYGLLRDRETALDYYTEYDQALHRGEQGLSPAAWMAQRSGAGSGSSNNDSAPGGQPQGGSNNDPAAALAALRSGDAASGGLSPERQAINQRRDQSAQENQQARESRKMESERRGFDADLRNISHELARNPSPAKAQSLEDKLLSIVESPFSTPEQQARARQLLGL